MLPDRLGRGRPERGECRRHLDVDAGTAVGRLSRGLLIRTGRSVAARAVRRFHAHVSVGADAENAIRPDDGHRDHEQNERREPEGSQHLQGRGAQRNRRHSGGA